MNTNRLLFRLLSIFMAIGLLLSLAAPALAQDGGPGTPTETPAPADQATPEPPAPSETPPAPAQPESASPAAHWAITGKVTGADGNPLAGVTVADDRGHATQTHADGSYSLAGLEAGLYLITPTLAEVVLIPYYRVVNVTDADVSGVDFHQRSGPAPSGSDEPPAVFRPGTPAPAAPPEDELQAQAAFSLGQPGLSYRYLQTLGVSEVPYTVETVGGGITHINGPRGLYFEPGGKLLVAEGEARRVLRFNDTTADLALGTAGASYTNEDGSVFNYPQDMAVDGDGNIWVTDPHRLVKYEGDGDFLLMFPPMDQNPWESGDGGNRFNDPRGMDYHNGRLYVADRGNGRVQVFDPAKIGTDEDPLLASIGGFNSPRAVLAVSDDLIYVVDSGNNRIRHCWVGDLNKINCYSSWGDFGGEAGSDLNHFNFPTGIAVDGGSAYISDGYNYRILKCDRQGNGNLNNCQHFAGTAGESGSDNDHFGFPMDVATNPATHQVYVSDLPYARVQIFNSDGSYDSTLGVSGVPYLTDGAHFNRPSGVAVSGSYLYVLERDGQRLLKLDRTSGAVIWTAGEAGVGASDANHFGGLFRDGGEGNPAVDAGGRIFVPDSVNHRIKIYLPDGSLFGQIGESGVSGSDNSHFNNPASVAIGPDGLIYVADRDNQRVQIFNSSQAWVATLGETGIAGPDAYHLNWPNGVAVDGSNNVFIADTNNHRVVKCARSGSRSWNCAPFAGVTGATGQEFPYLIQPSTVAVDGDGWVYILDNENYRIQLFSPTGAYWTTLDGNWGAGSGNLRTGLSGLAVASDKKVYLADSGNHRIQVYTRGVPGWSQLNLNGFGERATAMITALEYGPDGALYTGDYNGQHGGAIRLWNGGSNFTGLDTGSMGTENVGFDDLLIYNGYLYVSTWNGAWKSLAPGQIWRTPLSNLNNWSRFDNFSDNQDREIFKMIVFHEVLYAGSAVYEDTGVTPTRGARIYRFDLNLASPPSQVALQLPAGLDTITSFAEAGNYLYASAESYGSGGAMIYRCLASSNCDQPSDWQEDTVITPGFGDTNLKNIMTLALFNSYLYAGMAGANNVGTIWRCPSTGLSADCDSLSKWERVISDGFGDTHNSLLVALHVMGTRMYAITRNPNSGLQIWRCDGSGLNCSSNSEWEEFLIDRGFGSNNNLRVYSDASVDDQNGQLTIGAINWGTGGQLWRMNATAYSISGHVTSGGPLAGVTLTLEPGGLTQVTGGDGAFTFSAVQPGSYTLTPAKPGYTFTPLNRSFNVTSSNVINQDFSAITYPILLSAPADYESGVPLTALLDWEPASAPGASRYEVRIALDAAFTLGVKTALASVTQATFTKLVAGTHYYWQVRYCTNASGACVGSNFGTASPTGNFTTLITVQVPVLNLPANAAKLPNLHPTFTWDTGRSAAHHYRLQVSQSPFFTTLDVDEYILYRNTHYDMPSDLNPTRMYYWRVQALADTGASQGWSLVRTFTTLPAAVQLNSPGNNEPVDRLNTEFYWSDVYHAGTYHIQIARSTTFAPLVKDAVVTATHFVMPAALPGDTWLFWRVQAKGVAGVYGPWSEVYTFATPVPPAAPVLTGPAMNAVVPCGDNAPNTIFTWTSSPLSNIHLQWSTEPTFTWGVVRDEWQNDWRRSNYERRLDPRDFLWCSQLFYWRAQAERNVMGYNQVGPWSTARTFTAQPNRPKLNNPGNGENLGGVQTRLDWNYPDDLYGITFQVELVRCTSPGCTTTAPVSTLNVTTPYTQWANAENLPADQTILWHVRARGVGGFYGQWSDTWKFQTPATALAAPGIAAPANNFLVTTMPTILFDWNPVTGAEDYRLQIDTSPTFNSGRDWNNNIGAPNTSFETDGGDSYFQPGIYYWRVLARSGGAEGAWSAPRQFHTLGAVEGTVWHAIDGGSLENVLVKLTGRPDVLTDPKGNYKFWNVPAGAKTLTLPVQTVGGNTFLAQTRPISVVNTANTGASIGLVQKPDANTYRIVLTWKQNPDFNLDAHLWLPSASPYHIYNNNPGSLGGAAGNPHARLVPYDNDYLYTGGPEVITIETLKTGSYRFGVWLASPSNATTLKTTGAKVEVYANNSTTPITGGVFTIPTSGTGQWWYVFDLSSAGTLTKKNLIQAAAPAPYTDYAISGKVTRAIGSEVADITLGVPQTGVDYHTDNQRGVYTIPGLAPGGYTVTPRRMDYTFAPVSQSPTITNANVSGVNFTAVPDFGLAAGKLTTARIMGHYAYLAVGSRLVVLDIQDKAHPSKIAEISAAPAPIEDLAVAGDYAFLAQGKEGLQVIRISDPAHPVYAGGFYHDNFIDKVAVLGTYAYVSTIPFNNDRATLMTVDFSDPQQPLVTSSHDLDHPIEQLVAWSNNLYAAAGDWCLRSYTLSNPGDPSQTSQQCNGARTKVVAVWNDTVYFGGQVYGNDSQARFTPWNINNGNRWDNDITCTLEGLQASQQMLYAACADRGLLVLDAHEGWNIQQRGSYGPAAYHHDSDLALQDSFAFMVDDRGDFQVVDVANPNNPAPLAPGIWRSGDSALGISAATIGGHRYGFTAMGLNGLVIHEVDDPTDPTLVYPASYPPATWAAPITHVAVYQVGTRFFAFLVDEQNGLRVFEVTNPAVPVEVYAGGEGAGGESITAGAIGGVVYVFIPRAQAGVAIFSIDGGGYPNHLGNFDSNGTALQVFIGPDEEVYLADGENGLVVIDISDPANPTQKGRYPEDPKFEPWDGEAYVTSVSVAIIDGTTFAFLASGRPGMYVVDVEDPTDPFFVTQYGQGWAYTTQVFVYDNRAYLNSLTIPFFVLDVSDVKHGNLIWAGWEGSPSSVRDLFVTGGSKDALIYLAEDQNGARFMNYNDPTSVP